MVTTSFCESRSVEASSRMNRRPQRINVDGAAVKELGDRLALFGLWLNGAAKRQGRS
jgi:hypothetical protein